jgi:hypothetical protein
MVRVKVQCKDPTKVPRARIFVFKNELYLINFKIEGFEQIENSTDGDDGGVEELENDDDDLLDDLAKDKAKENESPKGKEDLEPKEGEGGGPPAGEQQRSKSGNGGSKSVKRALFFDEDDDLSQKVAGECVSLLEAMDLDGEDDESEDLNNMNEVLLQEDGEQVHLPDEWIYDLHTNNKVLKLCWIK